MTKQDPAATLQSTAALGYPPTMAEHADLRTAPVRVFTPAGWIVGTLHVPKGVPLLDFLNEPRGFFNLSRVALDNGSKLEFLAVARSAAILIIASPDELVQTVSRASSRTKIRQVSCLFRGGMVLGSMALPADSRVSDELMNSPGFFLLERCTVGIDVGARPQVEADAVVMLHAPRIVGVSEVG